jgi:hypothetical protein
VISPDYQYRIRLDVNADGVNDFQLKYAAGSVTGASSLVVIAGESDLEFIVDLAEIGVTAGDPVAWYALSQAGVPQAPETGIVDEAPNEGLIEYVVEP